MAEDFEGMGDGDQQVVADAERMVQIAAALTYIDAARHLLDGQHARCQVCVSSTATRTVTDEAGTHTDVVMVHQGDCPLRALQDAWDRLSWIFAHDA